MDITVTIKTCSECRHLGHSGAFTPGGARLVCEHSGDSDWASRVIAKDKSIPDWCPLKHGAKY